MSADYNPFLYLFGGLFASKPEPMTNAGRYLQQLDTGGQRTIVGAVITVNAQLRQVHA
ncbi:hypothetical protein [Stenotrophomonas maltophilia]|uniref:hypothetical protein n=1 Tax=Stenotrophomonas maltophilia TaxID=40324 RepID=UPI0013126547|nr:hypothetical protein [Stenotrophomonas maltophilia]